MAPAMYSRYLQLFIAITVLWIGAIAAFNYVVDPAWIYKAVEKPGFNSVKPKISKYRFIWKTSYLEQRKPEMVLLGNSRVETGMDPDAAHRLGLVPADKTIYNSAIPALSIYGLKRFVQQAIYAGDVKELYIGVDYIQFRYKFFDDAQKLYQEHEGNFVVDAAGSPQPFHRLVVYSKTLFSTDALSASFQTLQKQKPQYQDLTAHGFDSNDGLLRHILDNGSQRNYFIREEVRFIDDNIAASDTTLGYSSGIDNLREILLLAKQHHVKTTLFISPTHVHLQYLDAHAGDGDVYYNWKRSLVKLVTELNADSEQPVMLWDFSIPNADTMEPLPGNDHTVMQWYLDPSHFRSEMGERVLRRLMGGQPEAGDGNFGVLLTADNIEQGIMQHRQQLLDWQQKYPEDYAALLQRIEQRKTLLSLEPKVSGEGAD